MIKNQIEKGISNLLYLENSSPLFHYHWLIKNKKHNDYDANFKHFFGLNILISAQKKHITKFILNKVKVDSFGDLVLQMDKTKYLFSFASKILHMQNPNLPIYDSHIADSIGWHFQNKKSKLKNCNTKTEKVNELNRLWEEFQKTWNEYTKKDTKHCCELFDKAFPKYKHLSPTKKIDFMLWASKKA